MTALFEGATAPLVNSIFSGASLWMQLRQGVCKLAMVPGMTNKEQIVHIPYEVSNMVNVF